MMRSRDHRASGKPLVQGCIWNNHDAFTFKGVITKADRPRDFLQVDSTTGFEPVAFRFGQAKKGNGSAKLVCRQFYDVVKCGFWRGSRYLELFQAPKPFLFCRIILLIAMHRFCLVPGQQAISAPAPKSNSPGDHIPSDSHSIRKDYAAR